MAVNIQLEWTPNPSTLKYVVDQKLIPAGAISYKDAVSASTESPLGAKLFGVSGVTAVMFGSNFVTVTKGEDGEWDELNDAVMATLDEHLGAGLPAVTPEALEARAQARAAKGGSVEEQIRDILDAEIRPAVAQDGGDITLERYENGVAYLNMVGSCAGCPSSTATLKMGIETRLKEAIPELISVEAAAGASH